MHTLWVDPFGGLSGDIWVAGLQGLGADGEALRAVLRRFPFPGLDAGFTKVMRCGLEAHRAEIRIGGKVDDGSAPHMLLTGEGAELGLAPSRGAEGGHRERSEQAVPPSRKASFKAVRRGKPYHGHTWADVDALLKTHLEGRAADAARDAYRRLGEAEARVHGVSLADAHFHEVGNQDSIADVALAATAWMLLGEPEVHVGPIAVGKGRVNIAHGAYPIPTPATLHLLEGFEVNPGVAPDGKELTTPTGAALAAALATHRSAPRRFIPHRAVFAAGSYDFPDTPAASRFVLGRIPESAGALLQMETNVDDATPQQVAFAQARLMEAGALDAWVVPATFKKNRAGWVLGCLIPPAFREPVIARLVAELPTLGVRCWSVDRAEAERAFQSREVDGQSVSIKEGVWPSTVTRQPEYDDAARAAEALDRPLREIQAEALKRD